MSKIKVLSIGHSYVVASNRRFMEKIGEQDEFEVTIVAPKFMRAALNDTYAEKNTSPKTSLILLNAFFTKWIHIFFYMGLGRIIKKGSYDIIHLWEEPYILSGYQIARLAKKANIPLIFSTYQNNNKKYPWPFSYFEKFVLKYSSAWCAWAKLVFNNLKLRGYDEKKGHLIYPGIDEKSFFPITNTDEKNKLKSQLGLQSPTIVFLGRFVEDKGISYLLEALEKISEPWNLLLIGKGNLEDMIQKWIVKNNFQNKAQIKFLKHDEVPAWLRACDILVAPSITMNNWREQFGRMLVEGFASGLTVMGSNSGEIPYVIAEAGVIFKEKDSKDLQEKLMRVLQNPMTQLEYSKKGHERFKNNFSLSQVSSRYANLIKEVVNG